MINIKWDIVQKSRLTSIFCKIIHKRTLKFFDACCFGSTLSSPTVLFKLSGVLHHGHFPVVFPVFSEQLFSKIPLGGGSCGSGEMDLIGLDW